MLGADALGSTNVSNEQVGEFPFGDLVLGRLAIFDGGRKLVGVFVGEVA